MPVLLNDMDNDCIKTLSLNRPGGPFCMTAPSWMLTLRHMSANLMCLWQACLARALALLGIERALTISEAI